MEIALRALIVSLVVLGAVLVATHALALNPQPLPPGIRPVHVVVHPIVPKCPPGVHCLY